MACHNFKRLIHKASLKAKRTFPLTLGSSQYNTRYVKFLTLNIFSLSSVQSKSPSFGSSPTAMYSEALNASLQSALGFTENNLPFFGGGSQGSNMGGDALHTSLQAHYHRELRDREEKLTDHPIER